MDVEVSSFIPSKQFFKERMLIHVLNNPKNKIWPTLMGACYVQVFHKHFIGLPPLFHSTRTMLLFTEFIILSHAVVIFNIKNNSMRLFLEKSSNIHQLAYFRFSYTPVLFTHLTNVKGKCLEVIFLFITTKNE